MNFPLIGVVPLYDFSRSSVWMIPGYLGGLEQAGACPVILPYTENADTLRRAYSVCSGILFTGGPDVDPSVYGMPRLPLCGAPDNVRDAMEGLLLNWCMADDKPAFGICRGIQFFNAALGGTLWQDLPSQRNSSTVHENKPPHGIAVHRIIFPERSPLAYIYGTESAAVNSYHHQAIDALSPKLAVSAVSEDGLVEGVYIKDARFMHAVQWHPELDYTVNENSRALFGAFVPAAGRI